MSKKFTKTVALICAVCLACVAMCGAVFAENQTQPGETETDLTDMQIYVDGLLASRGYLKDGTTYAAMESLLNALGLDADIKWTADESGSAKTMTAAVDGIEITYTLGDEYLCANGRYIYLPGGCIETQQEVLFPVRSVAKIFTLSLTKDGEKNIVRIGTENMAVLEAGKTFYNADNLALLSHIIYAEAGNQPLSGMIGVGNVVMNRVNSTLFPNTIKDVVYAPGQFDPVRNGSINLTPNALSQVAACLTLEGYNTVGASLFFHNPGSSTGYLSDSGFVIRIQDHVFLT